MSSSSNPISVVIGWIAGLLGLGGEAPERKPLHGVLVEIAPGEGPVWGSLSGLTAHPTDPNRLFAVPDKDSPPSRIIEIDVSDGAARVVRQIALSGPLATELDTEGITAKPDGGFWIASEGDDFDRPANRLIEVDAEGHVLRAIVLPPAISPRMTKSGFEGVAYVPGADGGGVVYTSIQRPIEGDPDDLTRIAAVDTATGEWRFWHYPLELIKDDTDTTGLSELAHVGGGRFAAIERDGRGKRSAIKWVTVFELGTIAGAPADGEPPLLKKRVAVDLVPLFLDAGRKVEKEIEGLTIAADGQVYALTDNDTEPGHPTILLRLGKSEAVFGGK
ncbi:MAG: esterase-like activity of phytase family protein [Hyphomicrobiaceae bacterium]|nr:esterase-like activity of phytase family protein [Hyphomicrobiaceae bacterium]